MGCNRDAYFTCYPVVTVESVVAGFLLYMQGGKGVMRENIDIGKEKRRGSGYRDGGKVYGGSSG
jgi:hypothetical protein